MVTEVVQIIVRATGARAAAAGIRTVGTTSRTAAASVGLLTSALGALGLGLGAISLVRIGDEAIRLRNQIRVVTDSTEEFNAVNARVREVADRTRAPLEDTVTIYRRLRIATRDLGASQEDVLRVTEGLNAALIVTGASGQEGRAGLIQLGQGLASSRLSGDELRSVLENLPPLAQALADSLSRAGQGDLSEEFKAFASELNDFGQLGAVSIGRLRELGEAGRLNAQTIFPALLDVSQQFIDQLDGFQFTTEQAGNVLRNAFINAVGPINDSLGATEGLSKGILTLAKNMRGILVRAVQLFLTAAAELLGTGASLLRFFNTLGVDTLPTVTQALAAAGLALLVFIQGLQNGISVLTGTVQQAITLVAALGNVVGLVSDESLDLQKRALKEAEAELLRTTDAVNKTFDRFGDLFDQIAKNTATTEDQSAALQELAERARTAARDVANLPELPSSDFDLTQRGENLVDSTTPQQRTALRAIETLTNRIRVADERRRDPLDAQLETLNQQEARLRELAKQAGATADISEGLRLIDQQRLDIERERTALTTDQESLLVRLNELITQIAVTSPEFANELQRAALAAIAAGGGLKDVNQELQQLVSRGSSELQREQQRFGRLGERLGSDFAGGIADAIDAVANGEAVRFGQTLADISSDLLRTSLDDVFKQLGNQLGELLRTSFGGQFGGLAGGLIGIGAGLLGGLLQDTTADVQNEFVRSAVTDATELRGVVAGPTSIPILQVGNQLEDALSETNNILNRILSAIQGGPPAPAPGAPSFLLASTSPTPL